MPQTQSSTASGRDHRLAAGASRGSPAHISSRPPPRTPRGHSRACSCGTKTSFPAPGPNQRGRARSIDDREHEAVTCTVVALSRALLEDVKFALSGLSRASGNASFFRAGCFRRAAPRQRPPPLSLGGLVSVPSPHQVGLEVRGILAHQGRVLVALLRPLGCVEHACCGCLHTLCQAA